MPPFDPYDAERLGMAADEALTRSEGSDLRDAIKELTAEFKTFRTETAQTFVRQDNHQRDLQLINEARARDMSLITQTLTALKDSVDTRINATDEKIVTTNGRVDKIDDDSDWLKKLIYATIIMAVLTGLGLTAGSGLFK